MYKHERQQAARAMRGKIWSPGRPTTARRQDRVEFWKAIGRGLTSEDAAIAVGMSSAFGTRSFREAGGMPPLKLVPVSGRYPSFEEREEIAILHAKKHGVREIARKIGRSPSTISRELRWKVARRAASEPTKGRQAGSERPAARLRARPARRQDRAAGRDTRLWPGGALHRPPTWATSGPTVGQGVEPGTDLAPAAHRLP